MDLKLDASRFMLVFMKIEKMHSKVKYFEVNKDYNFHIANSTTHVKKSGNKVIPQKH
jgi:hypothetical protein